MHYYKQTYIYKMMPTCQLHADVYKHEGTDRRPGIVWIHGGGLVFGNRGMIPLKQMELYIAAGYTRSISIAPKRTALKALYNRIKNRD